MSTPYFDSSDAGWSGGQKVKELAVTAVAKGPAEDQRLYLFVEELVGRIEELVMEMPEVWARFGVLFGEVMFEDD